jgi:general secretion pathway protein L
MAARTVKERSHARLRVFLPPHRTVAGAGHRPQLSSSTVLAFIATDAAGHAERGDGPVPLLPKASQVDLVFDCADVYSAEVDAPKLADGKLRQALPNLLEERLLTEPADCHFAFSGRAEPSAKLPVAVVHRGLLTRALDVFAESGLRPRAAYSDIYTVPAPAADTLCVRIDRGRGVARTGAHEGFAFEFDAAAASVPPPALQLAITRQNIKRMRAFGREGAQFAKRLAAQTSALGVAVDVVAADLDPAASSDAVNLLQGSFASGGMLPGLPRVSARSLRAPLAWLGVAASVYVIGMNAYWLKLESERTSIRQAMQTAFKSAFPSLDADPELAVEQTRRELRTLRSRAGITSANDFSALNAQVAQLMSVAPVGAVVGVEFRDGALRVKFKPETGTDAALQNLLRSQAGSLGLAVRFDTDGSARVSVAGG